MINVSLFFILLFLFIFVFAILGMKLFAFQAKFNENDEIDYENGEYID